MQAESKHVHIPGKPLPLYAPKKTAQRRRSPRGSKRDQPGDQTTFAWLSAADVNPPSAAIPSAVPLLLFLAFSLASIAPPAAAAEPKEDSAAVVPDYLTEVAPLACPPPELDLALQGQSPEHQVVNKRHSFRILRIVKSIRHRRSQRAEAHDTVRAGPARHRAERRMRRHDRAERTRPLRDRWRRHH